MPDRAPGGAFRRGMFAGQNASSRQMYGDTGGNGTFGCCATPFENTKYASQYEVVRLPGVAECLRFAAFEAACTDSSRPLVVRAVQSITIVASSRPALAVTICCIMAMKRF
jgi:hypothetical protein